MIEEHDGVCGQCGQTRLMVDYDPATEHIYTYYCPICGYAGQGSIDYTLNQELY